MSEWSGTLTRMDAIRIIENITDKDDPAWEWAAEDFYDEESDTFPTLYEVLQTLGVTEAEYKSATNARSTNWPEVSDELYISQQVRIDSLESELSTLEAQREWVSVEERLPDEGQVVVLLDTKHFVSEERSHENVMHVGCYRAFGNYWSVTGERGFTLESFTHWQPLPPAPEGE